MSRTDGLLGQIEAGALDDSVRVSSLLRKCLLLGDREGSTKLREWARQELNGYDSENGLPDHRRISAPLTMRITNAAGYGLRHQELHPRDIPEKIHDTRDWRIAHILNGVAELEPWTSSVDELITITPSWSDLLTDILNSRNAYRHSHIEKVYWTFTPATLQGLLNQVRTVLAELVGELTTSPPEERQAAKPAKNNWWTRLRNRGALVALATVLSGVITILAWFGVSPRSEGSTSSPTPTTTLTTTVTASASIPSH